MKNIFKVSKWLHKYAGLLLILFLAWMGISGILLNHPTLIERLAVPNWMIPPQYHVQNWSRSALTGVVYPENDSLLVYASGRSGVWRSTDGGLNLKPYDEGLPVAPALRQVNDLLILSGKEDLLLAATSSGLYTRSPADTCWSFLEVDGSRPHFLKFVTLRDTLIAFSKDKVYRTVIDTSAWKFEECTPARNVDEATVPLIDYFFAVHDGSAWGLAGKLVFDAAGLILFFLSLSAFYSWYFPWKRRRDNKLGHKKAAGVMKRFFKWFLNYHLKLGIWSAAILFIIGFTGFFMRPPMLAALAGQEVSAALYPAPLPQNPWYHKIQNALYDQKSDAIMIAATDGMWQGPKDFSGPFRKVSLNTPLFVMGATVFEADSTGIMVGSFNGLYRSSGAEPVAFDIIAAKPAGNVSNIRLGQFMVTGHFSTPDGNSYIFTHRQGILGADGSSIDNGQFAMPEDDIRIGRMSLWKWLFELHNGRIFKDLVGGFYILLVPLGALLFLFITVSGVYDWLAIKWPRLKR